MSEYLCYKNSTYYDNQEAYKCKTIEKHWKNYEIPLSPLFCSIKPRLNGSSILSAP